MQENVESVKRKIEVLKLARIRIDKKQNSFVCVAIEDASDDRSDLYPESNNLVKQIGRAFERDGVRRGSTVGTWLHDVHGVPIEEMRSTRLREYRLRWLDSWIADLQKIVDAA